MANIPKNPLFTRSFIYPRWLKLDFFHQQWFGFSLFKMVLGGWDVMAGGWSIYINSSKISNQTWVVYKSDFGVGMTLLVRGNGSRTMNTEICWNAESFSWPKCSQQNPHRRRDSPGALSAPKKLRRMMYCAQDLWANRIATSMCAIL